MKLQHDMAEIHLRMCQQIGINWFADSLGKQIGMGQSIGNVGKQIGMSQFAGNVGKQIGKLANLLAISSYKSAGQFVRIYASILASFWFTRWNIYCINQAGLRVGQFTYPASELAGEQTNQNRFKL